MKTTARFKSHSLLTLFLFMSFATSNAQDYFNYNTVTAHIPNGIINKEKIDNILNSSFKNINKYFIVIYCKI